MKTHQKNKKEIDCKSTQNFGKKIYQNFKYSPLSL